MMFKKVLDGLPTRPELTTVARPDAAEATRGLSSSVLQTALQAKPQRPVGTGTKDHAGTFQPTVGDRRR